MCDEELILGTCLYLQSELVEEGDVPPVMVEVSMCRQQMDGLEVLFLDILTDEESVRQAALPYLPWAILIPVCGVAAFVWDGVFISLTRSMGMLISASIAWTLFFVIYWITPNEWGNNRLWIAYLSFLALRGIIQTVLYSGYLRHGVLEH